MMLAVSGASQPLLPTDYIAPRYASQQPGIVAEPY